jgi:hypothetical protein
MANLWGALFRSKNKLDGYNEYLIYKYSECVPALFKTRREAIEYINKRYDYLRSRKDMRQEPHGWMIPQPVKVFITYKTKGDKNEM